MVLTTNIGKSITPLFATGVERNESIFTSFFEKRKGAQDGEKGFKSGEKRSLVMSVNPAILIDAVI
ncbi:hypothetical protein GGI1_20568, partial [Acidithiobacillus sp. GGI-221]